MTLSGVLIVFQTSLKVGGYYDVSSKYNDVDDTGVWWRGMLADRDKHKETKDH